MTDKPLQTIAIVGGGFSGCLTAVNLLRHARQPLRILLIERENMPGRGVAYRDQSDCHLLNVRAESMSAFPDQPHHFLAWLNQSHSPGNPVDAGEFLPRSIYGAYIESLLEDAKSGARPGVVLETHAGEVIGLSQSDDGLVLSLRGGQKLHVDQAVLALGNLGPADPKVDGSGFFSSARYLGVAWSTSGLRSVNRRDDVLLIGSGLTTLDWLVALRERRHRGRIYVISRRGLLPHLHHTTLPRKLSFDPLSLPPRVGALLRAVRREAAGVIAKGGDWRTVIDALRPWTQSIWQALPLADQKRFLRHVRPYWEIHRHRAAPRIMEAVYELLRSGQLKLTAGRLVEFNEDEHGVEVRIRPRLRKEPATLHVQRVVNCTGPESDYRRLTQALIVDLREQGLIQADALGLGLVTDPHGALLDADNTTSQRLYTLGPPRKGQLWETSAVPEIRVQARDLALRLLDRALA